MTDIWSQKPLYQTDLSDKVRYSVIEPNAVAVLDSTGQFRLIDVEAGKVVIDEKLDVPSDLQNFHTMRSGDDLFVFITGLPQSQVRTITQAFDYPIINGPVYAFSMKTGKPLWPGPATVRNRGMMLTQPPDLPFLVFADRQQARNAPTRRAPQLRVLCLDKRTGETVYRNDRLPDTAIPRFRIEAETRTAPASHFGDGRREDSADDDRSPASAATAGERRLGSNARNRRTRHPRHWRTIGRRSPRSAGKWHSGYAGSATTKTSEAAKRRPKPAKNPANDTDDD